MTRLRRAFLEPRFSFFDEPASLGELLAIVGSALAVLVLGWLFVVVVAASQLPPP